MMIPDEKGTRYRPGRTAAAAAAVYNGLGLDYITIHGSDGFSDIPWLQRVTSST